MKGRLPSAVLHRPASVTAGIAAAPAHARYRHPRSAKLAYPPAPTTTWSSTGIPHISPTSRSRTVSSTSWREGEGSPDGWLWQFCARIRYVAASGLDEGKQPVVGHIMFDSPSDCPDPPRSRRADEATAIPMFDSPSDCPDPTWVLPPVNGGHTVFTGRLGAPH